MTTATASPPQVYAAIAAVQADLAHIGISKDRNNQQQGYKFRGIDDIYNAIAPLLAKHGLCILPRCLERIANERATKQGGIMLCVTVRAEFDLVSAKDGSKHTVSTYGEAMDSGDKATNKAMSAAYKYAAFQAFAIPTEGDNDADAHAHEIVRQAPVLSAPRPPAARASGVAITWTADQKAEAKGYADSILAHGPAAAAELKRFRDAHKESAPSDVIDALANLARTWDDIAVRSQAEAVP